MQIITERPADSLDAFSPGLARQERKRQKALNTLRRLRREAREEIDRLIMFLDESDIDPDLEDCGDDEPSLGWTTGGSGLSGAEDYEADEADDEDVGDNEPSLGWTLDGAIGSRTDLELCNEA